MSGPRRTARRRGQERFRRGCAPKGEHKPNQQKKDKSFAAASLFYLHPRFSITFSFIRFPLQGKTRPATEPVLDQLRTSGLYWERTSARDAQRVLRGCRNGAFLVRDSSDPRHVFAVSLKTAGGRVTHVRSNGTAIGFSLDAGRPSRRSPPPPDDRRRGSGGGVREGEVFSSVVRLLSFSYWNRLWTFPVYREVRTLKHMCRVSWNKWRWTTATTKSSGGRRGGVRGGGRADPAAAAPAPAVVVVDRGTARYLSEYVYPI